MEKAFPCETCSKRFASKDRLKNHELQHDSIFRYKCASCASTFRSKKVLKMHTILKHDAAVDKFNAIRCGKCAKPLNSQSAASAHFRGPCGNGQMDSLNTE